MTAQETDLDVAQGEIKGFAATWAIGGTAKPLDGYVGHLQVRARQGAFGSPALIDVSSIDGSSPPTIAMQPGGVPGKVSVRLPGELTALLKRSTYYYDLWVINATDTTERVRLMWGKFNVSRSATDNTAVVTEILTNTPGGSGGGFPGSGFASQAEFDALQASLDTLQGQVDDLPTGGGGPSSTPMPTTSTPTDFTEAGLLGIEWDGLDAAGNPMPAGFLRARVQRAFVGAPTPTQSGPTIIAADETVGSPWTPPSGWSPYADSTFQVIHDASNEISALAVSVPFTVLGPLPALVNDVGSISQEIAFTVAPGKYVYLALNLDDSVSGQPDCLAVLWQGSGPTIVALHQDGTYDIAAVSSTGSWAPVSAGGSFRLQIIGTTLKLLDDSDAILWTADYPGWVSGGGTKVAYLLTNSVEELAAYSLVPPAPVWTNIGDLSGGGVHLVQAAGTYRLQAESLAGDLGTPSASVSVAVDPSAVDHVGRGLVYAPTVGAGDDVIIDVENGYLQFFQMTQLPGSIQIVPPAGGATVQEFWALVAYYGADTPTVGFEIQGGGIPYGLVHDVLPLQSEGKAIKRGTNYLIHFFSTGGSWYYDWTDPAPDAIAAGALLNFGDVAAGTTSQINFTPLNDPNYPAPRMLEIRSVSMSGIGGKSCGLRLYSNPGSAAADAGRAWGTAPVDGTDCLLDIPNLDTYARSGQVSLSKVVGTGISGATTADQVHLTAVLNNGGTEDLVGVGVNIGVTAFRGSS